MDDTEGGAAGVAKGPAAQQLPPLAAEEYTCPQCAFSYAATTVEAATARLRVIPSDVAGAALAIPASLRGQRPADGVWSALEYVCHIRDVYAVYTIRLHRTHTEDRPALEPMLNELRAERFRYREREFATTLDELSANVAGFCDEIAHVPADAWGRIATRLPQETRTARWLVRQALHEGLHHSRDIAAVGQLLTSGRTGAH